MHNWRQFQRLLRGTKKFDHPNLYITAPAYRTLYTTSILNGYASKEKWVSSPIFDEGKLEIRDEKHALELINMLKKAEKQFLMAALKEGNDEKEIGEDKQGEERVLNADEKRALFIVNMLPFMGFGFLDNMIMIIAGEYIEIQLGSIVVMSTMAAAGFGNIISDVAGVGLAHYVELLVNKLGFHTPALTPYQWNTTAARFASKGGMAIGLIIGCLLGMFPLMFFDAKQKEESTVEKK